MEFPEDYIDGSPTEAHRAAWDRMDAAGKKRTTRRLKAISDWKRASAGITAAEAAAAAGVGISRFYKMASEWRDTSQLEALGTVLAANRKRASKLDGAAVNALQKVVSRVVAHNEDASVSRLVKLMVEAADVDGTLPGKMKLREIVETEMRRSEATRRAGDSIAFDCCATTWAASKKEPFCLFIAFDRGTRAILGHHVDVFQSDVQAYAAVARDVLANAAELPLNWTSGLRALQIVSGADEEIYRELTEGIESDLGISAKMASTDKRFGRHIRRIAGMRIGSIAFVPARTASGGPVHINGKPDVLPREEVSRLVQEAVSHFNSSEIMSDAAEGAPSQQFRDAVSRVAELSAPTV